MIDVEQIARKIARDGRPISAFFSAIRGDGSRVYLADGSTIDGYRYLLIERRLRELGGRVEILDAEARRRNTVRARALRN